MVSAQDTRSGSNGALPDLSGLAGRTPADRAAAGRAARAAVPRRSHAGFHPAAARPDPVALLTQQDAGRIADLLPIRFGRMLASPFAFLRGAALIMASDLSGTPVTGLYVQACGDAHLSNFGVYASPERRLVFDVNDFDETLPAPWEWDVKRLATSIEVAGRGNGFSRGQRRANVLAAVARYRRAMAGFAGRPELGIWYAPSELDELRRQYRDVLNRPERKLARADLARIRDRDGIMALSELTHVVQGQPRFVSKPPLLVPAADLPGSPGPGSPGPGSPGPGSPGPGSPRPGSPRPGSPGPGSPRPGSPRPGSPRPGSPGPGTSRPGIDGILARYRATLAPDRRHLVSRFTVADAARKVVGVGSVGMGCWIILLTGRDPSDLLVLQVKQATTSVLSAFAGPTVYHSQGKRVVCGQQLMQEASDIFLGWHSPAAPGAGVGDCYIRQLRDWKYSPVVEAMRPRVMRSYGELCGQTLARAHARSGDSIAIAAYLGGSDVFDQAVADFAAAYADQNDRDRGSLEAAVTAGRLRAERGV